MKNKMDAGRKKNLKKLGAGENFRGSDNTS